MHRIFGTIYERAHPCPFAASSFENRYHVKLCILGIRESDYIDSLYVTLRSKPLSNDLFSHDDNYSIYV